MLPEYVDVALGKARYEIIDDDDPFYGEIPDLKGVWSSGKTLEECRQNLKEVVEGWILLSIKQSLPIPSLDGVEIKELEEFAV